MRLLTPRQKDFVKEVVELGDLEDHPPDWTERVVALIRQQGLGAHLEAAKPLLSLYNRLLDRAWSDPDAR